MHTPDDHTPPRPETASTPAEFVQALRGLRRWSGLTYRQLAARAAAAGESLPPSTIATALGRTTLPRRRVVGLYLRACGLSPEDVRRWLAAREHLENGQPPPG